ncbi:MAG TPA: GAF domain-containing protein [Cyclobacteriaceae bacterium]|jgi:putative methionine-R-sulfoxide reductase with GAF domain|nr:GAF domain-containing protein [Cyclobacteriaceae bacterium]
MMSSLSTIRFRIAIGFFALLAIIILLELIAYYRIRRLPNVIAISALTQGFTKLQKEEISLKSTAAEFILREKNNLDFFKTGHSKFFDTYQKSLKALRENLTMVERQAHDLNLNEDQELAVFRQTLNEYDTIFRAMVKQIKERGYGKYGTIGQFDKAIMDLVRHDFGADNVAILNLQLYVKEYLLSGTKGATNNISNEIYNFSTVIERYVRDDQVESVINSLSNYENTFKKLVEIDDQLGTYTGQGLAKGLFAAASTMDAAVQLPHTMTKINQTYSSFSSQIYFSIILITGVAVFFAVAISFWLNRTIVQPFAQIKKVISNLGQGEIPQKMNSIELRDLNEIVVALNSLIVSIQDHHEFADKIRQGDFTASFQNMAEKDVLGKALLSMRDSLSRFDQENKQRALVAQGIAQFAELLRQNDDFKLVGRQIVSKLARDLEINFAGLYVTDDKDEAIELIASYGFDETRLKTKRVEKGNGLIGQAILSKEAILISPVPKSYHAAISSGLGQSVPAAILITPLKYNDITVGAIEIASLKPIEEYQRLFLEKVAETVASAVSSIRTNERNQKMLLEFQKHSQRIGTKEESFYQ